jgi:hypothetical protein
VPAWGAFYPFFDTTVIIGSKMRTKAANETSCCAGRESRTTTQYGERCEDHMKDPFARLEKGRGVHRVQPLLDPARPKQEPSCPGLLLLSSPGTTMGTRAGAGRNRWGRSGKAG